jgi:hypothetical protein
MPIMYSRSELLTETSEAGRGRRGAAESLPVECGVLQPIVQISPIGAAKRHSAGWQGLTTESIYAHRPSAGSNESGMPNAIASAVPSRFHQSGRSSGRHRLIWDYQRHLGDGRNDYGGSS